MANELSLLISASAIAVIGSVASGGATISYVDTYPDQGAGVTQSANFAGGYDLYSTGNAGQAAATPFGAGTRITSLPSYVNLITANGIDPIFGPNGNDANASYSYPYSEIDNPQNGYQLVNLGILTDNDLGEQEKGLLDITLQGTVPSTFEISVLSNVDDTTGDYPSQLRLADNNGGDSTLVSTGKPQSPSGDIDMFVFSVSGASAGDVLHLSGTQLSPDAGPPGYYLSISGLGFTAATGSESMPEPASFSLILIGGLGLLSRRRRASV